MASPVVSSVVSAAPESSSPSAATSFLWPADLSRWYLPEEDDDVGISYQTWLVLRVLLSSMEQWVKEEGKAWLVGSEQDMLLREDDLRVGVRPDAYLLPCIPADLTFDRWPAYQKGMPVPVLAVELVSPSNWEKDYEAAPKKYTVLGVEELLLVDLLAAEGKSPAKGAEVFQLYRRGAGGKLEHVYAGPGPVRSEVMGVWWREERGEIHLTRDQQGNERILTKEEAEREKRGIAEEKAKEEANARRIAEEKAKEEANARRIAEEKAKEEANARSTAEEKVLAGAKEAITDLCELLAIELTEAQRAQVEAMDLSGLRQLRTALKQQKRWPR